MHSLFFTIRRADLCSLAFQRELLGEFGITPARYLMLLAIAQDGYDFAGETKWLYQSDLWRTLGVSRMTVSVMVRSLEKLGLVKRTRQLCDDRRQWLVKLTNSAWMLLAAVDENLIRPMVAVFAIYRAFDMRGQDVGKLAYFADRFRDKFGDRSTFLYHWQSPVPDVELREERF